uniref:Uncharacterized protein n=1 Tax=Anopheles minimus TaxID=112268 RepID=A0A182WN77_9DIPT
MCSCCPFLLNRPYYQIAILNRVYKFFSLFLLLCLIWKPIRRRG